MTRHACLLAVFALAAANSRAFADEAAVIELKPADLKWTQSPSLMPGGQIAVLSGAPNKPGPYVIRVKLPPKFKIMPHMHPDDRTVTVISGTMYRSNGERCDDASLEKFPAGSFLWVPAKAKHCNVSKDEEVVFQVNGIGPTGSEYVNPVDDPRKK